VGGSLVVGLVIFLILLIVNFTVITKGSNRVSEVAARFTLDSMPGKQMAIDADLNAGLIDDKEATRRRRELEEESAFFGAMDGASKFVRGDAIAGIIITAVNVFGGIVIGLTRHGMSPSDERSAAVTTRCTPGRPRAFAMSAIVKRAWACGERSTTACSASAGAMSAT